MMIEARQLRFTYPKAPAPTLKGLDFQVREGEIFGFLGPSGSGKSTTQKLLIRLLRGYEGEARILGRDVRAWDAALYRRLGVGFELPNSFSQLTGSENLRLFASMYSGQTTRKPQELLELVGLADAANQRVKEYSKGMKMRLNFVRAILHDPELLFLDEPTAGMDPVNARVIKDLVLDMRRRGKTVFLTTHNMTDADELCDHVGLIVDGEIRLTDSPRALKINHGEKRVRVEYRGPDAAPGDHHDTEALQSATFPLDGLGQNPQLRRILDEARIETIHSQEATLEDVFIKTTGRSLR